MRRNPVRKCSWERFLDSKHGILDPNDTISRMPETVLHQIISFLPYSDKQHVRFLSRKWRRLHAQNQNRLSLTGRRLSELELSKIMTDDFHSVEFLTLTKCSGIKNLKLTSFKLLDVNLNYCGSLKTLDLNTPLLETFHFRGIRPCRIDFGICKKLTVLKLAGVAMYNMDYSITFPLLLVLRLSSCDMSGCINISSNSLKSLHLLRLKNPGDITIDAPNLKSFEYHGNTIIPFLNMHFPNLNKAMIALKPSRYKKRNEEWFNRLINMLQCLKNAKYLMIHTNSDNNIIVPKKFRETLVPPFGGNLDITVKTSSRSSNVVDLSDAMLWISPRLSSLYVESINWAFVLQLMRRDLLSVTHYSLGHILQDVGVIQ
ncbi:putative F-box domain, leucine-rich repeat domain superfamily, F-box-like domain superfamily [Helianthus annuus]|nr:putative F-box domain, leucine-rich repeat domain superfamily, F-box-like domain superfamily [Helianthus annuus]KAJ0713422.1 putative F-box domain, leucine-rich repeat domain superfamily, F-box-like domain superfamily [Helianthus annuus]